MKGIASTELIIAASVYIVGMFFFIQIISNDINSFSKDVDQKSRENIAKDVSQILFESKGIPDNWYVNITNITQLGLCKNITDICIISNQKLTSFTSLSPSTARTLLNLKNYNFSVLIKDLNNNTIFNYNSSVISSFAGVSQEDCLNESLSQVKTTVQVW